MWGIKSQAFGAPSPFWYPFPTSDDPEGIYFQKAITSGELNMKSMGLIGSVVLTRIGYKQYTDQAVSFRY